MPIAWAFAVVFTETVLGATGATPSTCATASIFWGTVLGGLGAVAVPDVVAPAVWWFLTVLIPPILDTDVDNTDDTNAVSRATKLHAETGHHVLAILVVVALLTVACCSTVPRIQRNWAAFAWLYAVVGALLFLVAPATVSVPQTRSPWLLAIRTAVFFTVHAAAREYVHVSLGYPQRQWRAWVPVVHALWVLVIREHWWPLTVPVAAAQVALYVRSVQTTRWYQRPRELPIYRAFPVDDHGVLQSRFQPVELETTKPVTPPPVQDNGGKHSPQPTPTPAIIGGDGGADLQQLTSRLHITSRKWPAQATATL